MEPGHNLDLATILRTLNSTSEATRQQSRTQETVRRAVPEWEYTTLPPTAQTDKPEIATDPRRRPTPAVPDSSAITTWAAGQRFVIDHIYRNQTSAIKIKQIIRNQHNQERQWWAEREALIAKHRGRAEKEKQVAEMLRSMGSLATVKATTLVSAEEELAELRRCDRKIHAAMTKMASDIDRELRATGVPFYAIKHDLVILEVTKETSGGSGRLDKGELKELQKRMLQLLEELFKE